MTDNSSHNFTSNSEENSQNLPENYVIVIGRQFGSGGRTIGKRIAEKLGISYFDTELLKKAAEAEGMNPEIFRDHEEKRPNILKLLLQGAYGIADNFHTVPVSSERIYNLQSKLIRDICSKGPCVIVGRNADFILRSHPHLLSIFLHAPLSDRAERILKRKEALSKEEAEELAIRHDRRRESYYNFYTGDKKWGVADNYHVSFDTSALDNDELTEIIIRIIKQKFNNQHRSEVCRSATAERKVRATKGDMLSNGKSAATSETM